MKISLLLTGKTDSSWLSQGIALYQSRLQHYIRFEIIVCQAPRKWAALSVDELRRKEGTMLLAHMAQADLCILLDEKGKQYDSVAFAHWLQHQMNRSTRHLMFVVGGAWGFSPEVYQAAHGRLSLSEMTFSHQMIRLFFAEQLYRAMTILKGESYHNA